jgi:Predicted P-loop ATPase fused to an acetyltransferase
LGVTKKTHKSKEEKEIRIFSGKLFPWQREATGYFLKFHKNLILTIKARRQCGKSYWINMITLNTAINYRNNRVVIVSPTFSNGKKMYKELEKYFSVMPQGIIKRSSLTDLSFELSNGSSIQYKSIEQGNALRGDKANLLIFDEAAFISTEEAMSLCFPYVSTTQGAIILVSTPKFKDVSNLFYKFYKKD